MSNEDDRPGEEATLPGDFIRGELKKRGWTQAEFAKILGRPLTRVNEIIQGKQGITPETAVALGAAFDTPPELWLRREHEYRLRLQTQAALKLSVSKDDGAEVKRRRRLFEVAPIKELQKRGWIRSGDDPALIEQEVLGFLEIGSLDEEPALQAVMRKSAPSKPLTPSQRAWCFRVRQLARSMLVAEFKEERLAQCERELRKAAAYSQETRKVPSILASYGIRFVIVENLAGGKIDGVTDWLDTQSPVIGISVRYDRVDSFWFTVCHELSHVRNKDRFSLDVDIADPSTPQLEVRSPIERRADEEAARMLIPQEEIESFVRRVGPLYSKERINQLANRLKIHPGIIVGQLQKRGEVGYAANREMLVKVRHIVTPVALTDGWGNTIDPRAVG